MAAAAERQPARQNEFENLILNRRVNIITPFITKAMWDGCVGTVDDSFVGLDVYGGLDLSEVGDLTALVLVANVEGKWQVQPTFWLPSNGLHEKAVKDRVPYDMWHKQGHLITTQGATVDYSFLAQYLFELYDTIQFKKIAFDRWNWRHLKPWLSKVGFDDEQLDGDNAIFEPFNQSYQAMSPALRDLEGFILNKTLQHGNQPVLNMCISNARVKPNHEGNRKLSKMDSTGRIDGAIALTMAVSLAARWEGENVIASTPWDDDENYTMGGA